MDLFITRIWNFGQNWVVDNLLLDHVGLTHVLDLAVHLVIWFLAWWVEGIIPRHSSY